MPSRPNGTNSEVFLLAITALTRAVERDDTFKQTYFMLMRYWLAFADERAEARRRTTNRLAYPAEALVQSLLRAARESAASPDEAGAIEVISSRGASNFRPAEWMLGTM